MDLLTHYDASSMMMIMNMHTLVLLATGSVTSSLLLVEGVVALLAGIEKLQLSAVTVYISLQWVQDTCQ